MTMEGITKEKLDEWATNPVGAVALHLKQRLVSVEGVSDEGKGGVVFPPTYADIGYNVDTLSDGTKVALMDSVGSQANRMEPMFKAAADGQAAKPLAALVPQIEIVLRTQGKGKDAHKENISLLDLAHRSADAVVRSCPGLSKQIEDAFEELRRTGNAVPLCALAPTSLVFGVWDSRGESGQKRPRLVRAVIRAWDVEPLTASSQFNSVRKLLDKDQFEELEAQAKKSGSKLADAGFDDVPSPGVRGGILVKGRIEREVTVNLVALRGLRGEDEKETAELRKYLLGLSLLAATAEIDLFLREGCNLRFAGEDEWTEVPRRGDPQPVALSGQGPRKVIEDYAKEAVEPFRSQWPEKLEYHFDLKQAQDLIKKASKKKPGDADKG